MKFEKLRKQVALLRKMGMFNPADETFEVRRALTADDLEAAYRLVHMMFADKGYITPRANGMRIREYEAVPDTATFICEHKKTSEIVAVMSVAVDSPDMGLPCDQAFKEEIGSLRRQGRKVCEFTNLAVSGKYWRSNAFTALTQACHAHARYQKCDDVFIAISPGHANFFESILVFDKYGDLRDYSYDKMDMVQGERLNLHTAEERSRQVDIYVEDLAFLHSYYFADNPFSELVSAWDEAAKISIHNAYEMRNFLLNQAAFGSNCDEERLDLVLERWVGFFDEIRTTCPERAEKQFALRQAGAACLSFLQLAVFSMRLRLFGGALRAG